MSTIAGSEKPISIWINRDDERPQLVIPDSGLSVFVVLTSIDRTLKALEKASELARPVGAHVAVIAVQVVPFPLPLDRPPIPMEFIVRRFEEKARVLQEVISVSAYLCRDPMMVFESILNADCVVVMGIRKRWWPTRDEKLARRLRRAGYEVILVEAE